MKTIRPMLAETLPIDNLDKYINNDEWVIEQKLDGERIAMHITDSDPTPLNRKGDPYTRYVAPAITQAFTDERWDGEWVLDGELLNGTYYVFDLPWVHRNNTTFISPETPYHTRHDMLTRLFDLWQPPAVVKLVTTATTPDDKKKLIETVTRFNGEGVMLKHTNGRYLTGSRSNQMLKAKFTSTADVFIIDICREGKRSVAVGLRDNDGNVIDIGTVAMSDRNLERIGLDDVIEVRYLYVGNGNRLYQPAFMRVRTDKTPSECTTDQLKYVNKTVI